MILPTGDCKDFSITVEELEVTLEGLGAWGFEGFPGLPAASKPASLTMRRAVGAEPGGREKSSTKINQLAQFRCKSYSSILRRSSRSVVPETSPMPRSLDFGLVAEPELR